MEFFKNLFSKPTASTGERSEGSRPGAVERLPKERADASEAAPEMKTIQFTPEERERVLKMLPRFPRRMLRMEEAAVLKGFLATASMYPPDSVPLSKWLRSNADTILTYAAAELRSRGAQHTEVSENLVTNLLVSSAGM